MHNVQVSSQALLNGRLCADSAVIDGSVNDRGNDPLYGVVPKLRDLLGEHPVDTNGKVY